MMRWMDATRILTFFVVLGLVCVGCEQGTDDGRSVSADDLRGTPSSAPSRFRNFLGMEFVYVGAGSFQMGRAPDTMKILYVHGRVTIRKPFYLGTTEVTRKQFVPYMVSRDPRVVAEGLTAMELRELSRWMDDSVMVAFANHPQVLVSWEDAVGFCEFLGRQDGRTYRLPTEQEWEYACRAGSKMIFGSTDSEEELEEYAWFRKNSNGMPHPVKTRKPNAWGLYDMIGNVSEWTQSMAPDKLLRIMNDTGPSAFVRGGAYFSGSRNSWCASRWRYLPLTYRRSPSTGFRVVCEIEER